MSPDLTALTPEDHALLDSLDESKRQAVLTRLAVIQQVADAPMGTKNTVMTRLSDQLRITIGGVSHLCALHRKSGLAGLIPRIAPRDPAKSTSAR